ncbi:MAG: hypothetical protein ACRC62_37825, partial [Microcoleus sp.]
NLKGLTKRNKIKQDDDGTYLPNGQSAKSGLNKSWQDAAFGQFFKTLDYIALKAGAVVVSQKPAYTSMVLCEILPDLDINLLSRCLLMASRVEAVKEFRRGISGD